MKILIKVNENLVRCFFVCLNNKQSIKEVKKMIQEGDHSKAIDLTLSKGKVIKEVNEDEMSDVDTQMILTENGVRYDLM